jgi:hypothetical protein
MMTVTAEDQCNRVSTERHCGEEHVPVEMWDIFSARPAFSTAATESKDRESGRKEGRGRGRNTGIGRR